MSEPSPELDPLPPDVADYVAAFRDVEQPGGPAADATWAAIEAQAGADGGGAGAEVAEEEPRRRGAAWIIGAGLAVAAAVLLMLLGPRLLSSDDAERAPAQAPFAGDEVDSEGWAHAAQRGGDDREVSRRESREDRGGHHEDAPPPEAPPPVEAHDAAPEPTEPDDLDADGATVRDAVAAPGEAEPRNPDAGATKTKAHRTPRTRKEATADPAEPVAGEPPSNPLREEAALFGQAKLALVEGDARGALKLLDEHASRFPKGALGLEAKVVRVEALCELGRRAQAQKLRDRFIERHSGSTLAARMGDICR